jgi:signal peptidase II
MAVIGTIGCDHVTKHVARTTLAATGPHSYLADTVRIVYAENPGGFLSLGAALPVDARTIVFIIATGLLLLTVLAVAIRFRWRGPSLLGVSLFVAGGASNWLDRFVHGAVVDFLNVGIGPVRTGIFNVADIAIMLGLALIVVGEAVVERRSSRESSASAGPEVPSSPSKPS